MKESEKLELKKSLAQLKEGIISCSAMLNKNHSGTVIFGINDDGRVTQRENPLDREILNAVKENKYITIPELAKLTGKSDATIYRHLESLSKAGKIQRVGSRKTGYWDLLDHR